MTDPRIDAVRAARADLDAVIEEIRRVDGFEGFLAPPSFDDVAAAARAIPLGSDRADPSRFQRAR
jgi:hypothetical protein